MNSVRDARKAAFLDRDGVINRKRTEGDYVKNWEEFEFLPGAIEGMKLLVAEGYDLYIATNQRGVARGMMTDADVRNIHKRMKEELKKWGVELKGIYYCPHEKGTCDCRKPLPGMFLNAAHEHHIDLSQAACIGDSDDDIKAGKAAGCAQAVKMPVDGNLLTAAMTLVQNIDRKEN